LTEPGEPQGLIGNPARAVIDHENKSTGQQQQPQKSEKTADHASPYICLYMSRPARRQPITGQSGKFNLISTLSAFPAGAGRNPESVDAAERALYKTANGGGRNPAAAVL
jgi:hypothetical protein